MVLQVSPGLVATELDLSLYTPAQSTTVFAVVGTASWGPTEDITQITDEGSLVGMFGPPSTTHLGLHSAIRYLRVGRQLKFVRVADYDAYAAVYVRNLADTGNALYFRGVYTGSFGNSLSIQVTAGTISGTYRISVLYNSVVAEIFDNVYVGAAYTGNANYVTTRINGVSVYVSVTAFPAFTTLNLGTVALTGGDDGAPVSDSALIGIAGSPPTIPTTGLQLFSDADAEVVDMIAIPGRSNANIVTALVSLTEARQDCLAILEVPYGKSVQAAIDWHNGTGGGASDPAVAINSSYAALYYPWVQVYDGYSDAEVWISPAGHIAEAIAYNDFVAQPWFAAAGMVRGRFVDILDLEHSATLGEREYMYGYGNAINPITNFVGISGGTAIWGQRTLLRATTALDRINVRRMLNYVKRSISTAARQLLFEPNDPETWSSFTSIAETFLSEVKSGRGLIDYRVICDETTNTAAVVDNNQMVAKILLKPTKTAEVISLQFVLLPTGASFAEFT